MGRVGIVATMNIHVGAVAAGEDMGLPHWVDLLMTFALPLAVFVVGLIFVFDYRGIVDKSVRAHRLESDGRRPPWRSDESYVRLKQISKLIGIFFVIIGGVGIVGIVVKIYNLMA